MVGYVPCEGRNRSLDVYIHRVIRHNRARFEAFVEQCGRDGSPNLMIRIESDDQTLTLIRLDTRAELSMSPLGVEDRYPVDAPRVYCGV